MAHPMTANEWNAIPDPSGLELVDGLVHTMAAVTARHEEAKTRLRGILERLIRRRLAGPGLVVSTGFEVRLAPDLRRRPDVLVTYGAEVDPDGGREGVGADKRPSLAAVELLLAVEVVDVGTETLDRRHKPADYAAAGIPHYWRVEPRPRMSIHTYRLGESGGYLETGLFTEGDRVDDPTLRWAAFDVDEL